MIEAALRRDRAVVAGGLAIVVIAAWSWLLSRASMMGSDGHMAMPRAMAGAMSSIATAQAAWSLSYAVLIFVMWWVMMVAMMVPSAAPLVLLAAALHRRKAANGQPALMATLITAGYLVAWGAFSLVAVLAQWGLEGGRLLSREAMQAGPVSAGAILIAAGIYQLTPFKQACLRRCRSPVAFVAEYWQPGGRGAFRMGLLHGAYCVGCCWFLMALLFVGGVMNAFWIGGIAAYVLIEKFVPGCPRLSRAGGLLAAGLGVMVLLARAV